MAKLAAVVGIGQTHYKTRRGDVSIAGLVREAAVNALEDAGLGWDDIEAVIIGKAPDMFEGVIMPEIYLTDALGCNGKPMLRVHTAGSVGGSTALVAASHVQSGMFKRVLTVTFEKQSESNAMWALSTPQPFSVHLNAGAGGYFAPIIREYMRRSRAPYDVGIKVAVKDRLHGARNPLAHLQLPEYHDAGSGGLHDVVGPDPLPRGLPFIGRRLRHGHRRRGTGVGLAQAPRLDSRRGDALGTHHVRRARGGQPAGRPRLRRGCLSPGGYNRPAQGPGLRRGICPVQLV